MPLWKPLLLIAPAGLLLGAIGGRMAQPVLTQRETDATLQAMFQTRADRYGSGYPAQTADVTYYNGGSSFVPDWVNRVDANWSPPHEDAWSYSYAAAPLPSVAQLDARQAALLADPDKQFAVHRPDPAAEPAEATLAATPDPSAAPASGDTVAAATAPSAGDAPADSSEPRKADGEPAIW